MDEGGEMGSFRYMASDMGIVVVVRLKVCIGYKGVWVSELWGSEGVGMEMVGSKGE